MSRPDTDAAKSMGENFLIGFAAILVLGIGAYWLAWKLSIPAILLLLLSGFVAGPVTGLIDPDRIFGHLLLPVVTMSVAVILFEGGMNLKFSELRDIRKVVFNLVTIGVLVTWAVTTAAAYFFYRFDFRLSILLGAILVVTGPTVILPLLRDIRASGRIGSIMKWEGIVIDPLGALLAVLVYHAIVAKGVERATFEVTYSVLKTLTVGVIAGVLGARLILLILRKYWVPDYLQSPVTLMILVAGFTLSNHAQQESGLVTATIMGVVLANQKKVSVKRIMEFKETLRVLFISSLFIILASGLTMQDVYFIANWKSVFFLAALFFVARPLSVFLSTYATGLSLKEKLFLSWMAPRGIIAASVASVFALRLAEEGIPHSEHLISVTFLVIAATVTIYGITAYPFARKLGIARPDPQGVLIVGAHSWARAIAKSLLNSGYSVALVDSNWSNVSSARQEGLKVYYKNILLENVSEHIDCDGIGKLLAMTSSDEVNSLATLSFVELFGRSQVYQLPRQSKATTSSEENVPVLLSGRYLFTPEATFQELSRRFGSGAVIKKTHLTPEFTYEAFNSHYGDKATPLFLLKENGELITFAEDNPIQPQPGHHLIVLVAETEHKDGPGVWL